MRSPFFFFFSDRPTIEKMMSHHKAHSSGTIPFSWENQPGISKVVPRAEESATATAAPALPPPPCAAESPRKSVQHGLHVPLPPCGFQGTMRSSSTRKGSKKDKEDPFLAAYMECTKSAKKPAKESKRSSGFSCKSSVGVREDVMVRASQARGKRPVERKGARVVALPKPMNQC